MQNECRAERSTVMFLWYHAGGNNEAQDGHTHTHTHTERERERVRIDDNVYRCRQELS